jgi:hypothetical protein
MGKREQQDVRSRAREVGDISKQQTGTDIYGGTGPGGVPSAFGPGGLSGQRTAAMGRQLDTLGDVKSTGRDVASTLAGAKSGYQDFATTGGMTPQQQAQFMRTSTAGVPAAFDVMKSEAMRQKSLTGGLGPGGQISQMARQEGETAARANTAAEVALSDQLRQGKLAGLGGLTDVGRAQTGLMGQQNQLFNTQTGEISDIGKQILARLGIDTSNQQLSLETLQSLANTPGIMDNIQRIAAMAGGAIAGAAGV